MTLDEAIKHAEELAEFNYRMAGGFHTDEGIYLDKETKCRECAEEHEQLAEWLKELKQLKEQTDGDLISRQAVIDIVEFECGEWKGLAKTIVKSIEKLPSEEKTAEWIFWTSKSAKCSNCGHIQFTNGEDTTKNTLIHKALYHYCPNCGAKMKEGD